jgi:hypothetical protein
MEKLCDGFNAMGEALEERQRLKQALALAMEIQQHLLPSSPPTVAGVDVAGFSDYCDETGGDYFDFPRTWALEGGRLAITVGDVTGHGIGAALLMSSARAVLRTHAERDEPPATLLSLVNHALVHDAIAGKFMTLYYGVLDPKAGTLRYGNGGQGGCYVLHVDGRVTTMPAMAPPLGVFEDVEMKEAVLDGLVVGDVVLLASDGVWETANAAGELFGTDRMVETAVAHRWESADAISAAVRAAADAWRGTGPQTDDVTVLVARLVGEGGAKAGTSPPPAKDGATAAGRASAPPASAAATLLRLPRLLAVAAAPSSSPASAGRRGRDAHAHRDRERRAGDARLPPRRGGRDVLGRDGERPDGGVLAAGAAVAVERDGDELRFVRRDLRREDPRRADGRGAVRVHLVLLLVEDLLGDAVHRERDAPADRRDAHPVDERHGRPSPVRRGWYRSVASRAAACGETQRPREFRATWRSSSGRGRCRPSRAR